MSGSVSFEVVESGVRGGDSGNHLSIPENTSVVTLEFVLPVLSDRKYNFELYDPSGVMILSRTNVAAQKVFAWPIPASYLEDGDYTMKVVEWGPEIAEAEPYIFKLEIRPTD